MLSELGNPIPIYEIDKLPGSVSSFLNDLDPVQRAKVLSRIKTAKNYSRERRVLFEKYFDELPQHIREGLKKGKLRLSDHTIYAIKQVKEKSIQIFEKNDEIITGICNIKGAELPKNMVMLVCDLRVMAGISLSDKNEDISISSFDNIRRHPVLLSGEYSIKVNSRSVTNGNEPLRNFLFQGRNENESILLDLHNPFLIPDEKPISFEINLGSLKKLEPLTFFWVGLEGVCTIENNPSKAD